MKLVKENDALRNWMQVLQAYRGKHEQEARLALRLLRRRRTLNIKDIEKRAKGIENVIAVGKVCSLGEPTTKRTISAIGFSKAAKEKIEKAGWSIIDINQMLQKDNLKVV